ncbi:MAG: hypothetical protein ACI8V5_003345 [Limisphaerales bacterium]|jgi:hypothetical protein
MNSRILRCLVGSFLFAVVFPAGGANDSSQLFDRAAIRDASTLETKVIHDWKPSAKDASIRQKLIEITICEWWPGQKVRLPVTLSAPATGGPCRNVLLVNQTLALRTGGLRGNELELLKKHGVPVDSRREPTVFCGSGRRKTGASRYREGGIGRAQRTARKCASDA